MSAQKCAYTSLVQWTPERIRREREARGWSQRQLREAITASSADGKISLRAVTAWEAGESMPSGRNIAALDRVFAAAPETESNRDALASVDDLELLAEVARRMAGGNAGRPTGTQNITTPGANQHLRWDTADLPSSKRAQESDSQSDTRDARA